MPRAPESWGGAAALWVTVAGWLEAEARRGGTPLGVLTPDGLLSLEGCLAATEIGPPVSAVAPSVIHRLPQGVRQLGRDLQRSVAMRRYGRAAPDLVASGGGRPSGYVWQHHELFHGAGGRLATAFDVPLIEYVHAPIIFEAARWNVTRRGTGRLLERTGEQPQLAQADLVACVSEEVRLAVQRLGVEESRTIVSPMGVDAHRFRADVDGSAWRDIIRQGEGETEDFVVMWTGSLRRFHHLDVAVRAIGELRRSGVSARLVIAGSGPDRQRLEEVASAEGASAHVRFLGQLPSAEMPALLSCADAAVVTAGAGQLFHYSPLKLREYLAMSLPVVAADIGDVSRMLDHGRTGLLYEPGDASGLAAELAGLADDSTRREQLGDAGRLRVLESWTWDAITRQCLERLSELCGS